MPDYQDDDTPTISGIQDPPIMYKCPSCEESFHCPKERRIHQNEKHQKTGNEVGSLIGKKKVKKLTIKPKKVVQVKEENNFDFKLKIETEPKVEIEAINRASVILSQPMPLPTIEKVEDPIKPDAIVCSICDFVLPNLKALRRHKAVLHSDTAAKHKCTTCGETFPSEPVYSEHLKIHPLECRLCGKLFYRKQSMQLHTKRHLGIKPYKCLVCEKSFLTKQKLDEHSNIHTGEAPIKCTMCDETFRRHSNLVQHRNRHHLNVKKKVGLNLT